LPGFPGQAFGRGCLGANIGRENKHCVCYRTRTACGYRKPEIRNQKPEGMLKTRNPKEESLSILLSFRVSGLGFPSDFGFLVSGFHNLYNGSYALHQNARHW
jgi:hypothetical protein